MSKYPAPTRRQHVHMVRDSDEIVIHFTSPKWHEVTATLSSENGVVSITVEKNGVVTKFPIMGVAR